MERIRNRRPADTKNSIPTSNVTSTATVIDGFTTSQTDHAGITSTQTRSYAETGIIYASTDGRGNTTTTKTDIAGRTVSVTDAAGNTTSTAYGPYFDQPSVVTNALGNTMCYSYDLRAARPQNGELPFSRLSSAMMKRTG